MRRFIKILHEISTVGYMGAILVILVLLVGAQGASHEEYAAIRRGIVDTSKYIFVPSLAVVILTGLIALGMHVPYHEAGWAWLKALLGLIMFEGSLFGIAGNAEKASLVAADLVAGVTTPELFAEAEAIQRHEWASLWVMLGLSVLNIVLAIARPKFMKDTPPSTAKTPAAAAVTTTDAAAAEPTASS